MDRCKNCKAVVNPKWSKCFACGLPLNLNKPKEPTTTKEQIVYMTLKEFSRNRLAMKVYSKALKKEVWFVSNEKMRDQLDEGKLVAYLPQELKHLIMVKPEPEELKKIHLVKETFPGSEVR